MTGHAEWDAKHREQRAGGPGDPDPFVVRALDRLGPGAGRAAWDLAAGRGRHALELARRGWRTVAFDRSAEALAQITASARDRDITLATAQHDLARPGWGADQGKADLIVVVNYLDRALFARLPSLLLPGGWLLLTTFTTDREGEHPSDRWCLEPHELESLFPAGAVEFCAESGGRAGALARFRDRASTEQY